MFDCIIRNGKVFDGAGSPWFRADVGIKDGKITSIGDLSTAEAERIIDAKETGLGEDPRNAFTHLAVAPGFIDCHNHGDFTLLAGKVADSMIRQGVVTQIVGHCGFSPAPVNDRNRDSAEHLIGRVPPPDNHITWTSFDEYLAVLDSKGLVTNITHLVGHLTIRQAVIGPDERPATKKEIELMKGFLKESMDAGANGLSAGLEFFPARCTEPEEIKALCTVAAKYGGLYVPHIRNRDQFYETAVEEALWVARETGVNLQLAHLNCRENNGAAEGAWEKVVALLERARDIEGVDVTTDTIPYAWGPGGYLTILPAWVLNDGIEITIDKLKNPDIRQRLSGECDRYWRFIHRGQWERVMLSTCKSHPEFVGKTFTEIAALWEKAPWDCYFDIIIDEGVDAEGLHLYGRLFDEGHVQDMVTHPLFMLASDAYPQAASGPLSQAAKNLGSFGWTARVLGHYVREKKILTTEDAIRKMTSFPATKYGLKDRGLLKEGMVADIVVFDPDVITETGTIDYPNRYPTGIEYVLVNGKLVVDQGTYTGDMNGELIRRESP